MDVLSQLAASLGRNDEHPNIALAEVLVAHKNADGVRTLVDLLNGRNKALKSDSLKTLYEVGARAPEMIAPYIAQFKNLLTSPDNRMVWGAMCAIDAIAGCRPEAVFRILPQIMAAVDKGTVITRDHAVKAMVKLAGGAAYARTVMPLLHEQIRTCPVNQLPMYAELVATVVTGPEAARLAALLGDRLVGVEAPAKRKRLEKVLKRLTG